MGEKKFAFETDEISVAFPLMTGLGDAIIAKKLLSAVVELAPNCVVDVFCLGESQKIFVQALYSDIKNMNLILPLDENSQKIFRQYDLIFNPVGSWGIFLSCTDAQKLQIRSPELLTAVKKVGDYNKVNIQNVGSPGAVSLRNFAISRILNKNCYEILSCDGALPVRDNKVTVPLAYDFKPQFDALKLDKYITIYTDIAESEKAQPKVKTYPIRYFVEYVTLMKKSFPNVEIVQVGAKDVRVENADRHYLSVNLELTKYILANSLLHVGGEGGLIHLATALGTKCLVLFGFSSAHYYGYNQNINLVSEICYPCANVLYNAMTCICMRGAKEPPCMLAHTPKLVCEVTCNYLKNKA